MTEYHALHYAWLVLRTRLTTVRRDQRGAIGTLEMVLLLAGIAVLALATVVIVTQKVNDATNNIPTGPAAPGPATPP